MSEHASSPSGPAWHVLRHAPFRRYMTGETISMLGTWMQQTAQGWVVAGLTSSAFTLGLIHFCSGIPMLLLTMHGGLAADRYDKRRILIITQVVQIVLAISIGWLVGSGQIAVWHVVVAGVLLGISTAFEMPAAAALVPELVERSQLKAAIAVDRSTFHATRLAGPAIGGWLIGWLGTASAFYANALSFVALIMAMLTLHPRPPGTEEEEAMRQTGMKEGFDYVRRDKPTLAMIWLLATLTTCISPFFMITMPLYSRHVLHIDAQSHGLLMASSGIGAFLGSLWLLTIKSDRRAMYMRWGAAVVCVCMLSLALAQHFWQAIAAMSVLTLGTSTMFGLANTIVQERAPDAIRGRVSAILGLSFFGVLPFSGLAVSEIADLVGLRVAMAGGSLLFGLSAGVLLYSHRRLCMKQPVPAVVVGET
nr:MFS transporter [Roseimicrobium sp. ORNL1]